MTFRHSARRVYGIPIGQVLNWLLATGVFILPTARNWKLLENPQWLVSWILAYLFKQVWDFWLQGSAAEGVARKYARTNSSLAGWVDDLGRSLRNSADQRLGETECRGLAVSLLARIREFTQQSLALSDEVRLRATLAVPLPQGPRQLFQSLRVWCYDQPYDDRRWTELALHKKLGRSPRGSPESFVSGRLQVIDDVHTSTDIDDAQSRQYRSVLSIPVKAGGPWGETLAILNIDATEPYLFTEEKVKQVLVPVLAPAVNLVALLLLMRRKEAKYVFGI